MRPPRLRLGRRPRTSASAERWRGLPEGELGRVVAVTGATGAPGRTFVAINLAGAAASTGLRTCLVDADPELGAVAVALDLGEDRSLPYLAHQAALRPIDQELVSQHLQAAGDLQVLAGHSSPAQLPLADGVLLRVMEQLRRSFELVVADVGALTSLGPARAAAAAQLVVWVCVPDRIGADLLDRTLSASLAAPLRSRASMAVLNRIGPHSLASPELALQRRYGLRSAGEIPAHSAACAEATALGRPAVLGGALHRPLRAMSATVLEALGWQPAPATAGIGAAGLHGAGIEG